ncbi:MAG: peroxiredoxin [Metamycoplasmataceae bacterium]
MKTKFKDKEWNLIGEKIELGKKLTFKAIDTDFNEIDFGNVKKTTILSIFPSINTSVCDFQTKSMNEIAKKYHQFDFVAISLDLPTALKVWCGSHNVNNIKAVSDYKDREFGKKSGFLIDELFLLNRGIIILDKNNKVIYLERKTDVHDQIDFEKLETFLNTLN